MTSNDTTPSTIGAPTIPTAINAPDIPPMWFTVPDGFHSLPIAATAEERAAGAAEFVRELFPGGDDNLWTPAAPFYAGVAELMGDAGLAFSAIGLFGIDNGGVAHCSLTVAAIESDHPSVEVAATGIREILTRDPVLDARWIDLPCGPAVSSISMREVTIGAEFTATGEEAKLLTGQIQVYIPFPTGPYTAVFTLDTAAVDYWGEISDMTVAILRTVSFTPPADGTSAGLATE